MPSAPDLSVVIPALDEAGTAPQLLRDLLGQQGIRLEALVVDGGSRDGTPERCRRAGAGGREAVRVLTTSPGRGRQMNLGAGAARAPDVLFLHADSRLEDPDLLARARAHLAVERTRRGPRVAGRFGVRFLRSESRPSQAYYFYEAKSRLNRRPCVNGDQGFWLGLDYFRELGGFDETLPYLEDARLADRVFESGAWITLPGRLGTSARRFESEGLGRRQTLNALVRAFDRIGLVEFFGAAAEAYRVQEDAAALRLKPFLRLAHRLSVRRGPGPFLAYWARTGAYVAANAWQIAFALDCLRNRRAGFPPGEGPTTLLGRYDRWLGPAITSPPGRLGATLVTMAWFYGALLLPERRRPAPATARRPPTPRG